MTATETIHGLSLEQCAQIMAKDGALKAQYGERDYKPHFTQFLAAQNLDESQWAQAWNGWWTRMEADPSGQLHAKFAMIQQKQMASAHFADVKDASQDVKGGMTLDMYARTSAHAAGGGDLNAFLAEHNITQETWQSAQREWNAAMGADTNHHITTQYGQLYAKYTPGFEQQMQGQVAGIMAANYAERQQAADQDDEEDADYTVEQAIAELGSPKKSERWTATRHVATFWDIGEKNDPALNQAAKKSIDIMIECLEQHDEFTVSDAESSAEMLQLYATEGFLADKASDAHHALSVCLARGKEKLATLKAAFAPIADKAVPERVTMQSQIQDYTSLVESLEEVLADWEENLQSSASNAHSEPPVQSSGHNEVGSAIEPSGDDFMSLLRRLPIIGDIMRALGL